jgi:nitrate/TMAO reductase-like tetraheme cytochrome c subunit
MAEDPDGRTRSRRRWIWGLGLLALGGLAGLAASAVTATVVERTNTNAFCVGCHEMTWPQATYREGVHFANASGVRASCSSCHEAHDPWWRMLYQKTKFGLRDFAGHVTGELDTREKFEAKRLEMARNVWSHLEATESGWCKNCHTVGAMALDAQSVAARAAHRQAIADKATCIDCHKGVGHGVEPPDESARGETGPARPFALLGPTLGAPVDAPAKESAK